MHEIENNPEIRTAEQLEQMEAEVTGQAPLPLPVEGAELPAEAAPLTIDEGKKKTPAVKGGAKKRKAEEASLTPQAQKPNKVRRASGAATVADAAAESTPTTTEPERTSRSGRKIKPKRFNDDMDTTPNKVTS